MPDKRQHRGPHPEDAELFSAAALPSLRAAAADLSWLLGRDYASAGAVKLVGDRYGLTQRQRTAVMRAACADSAGAQRQARSVAAADLAGQCLLLDGYNILTTIEAALSGGVILACRDGTYRDMASIHGTYRKVEETPPALELAGRVLEELGAGEVTWYLDSPVSNSGRLKMLILETARAKGWNWRVEVVIDPDYVLARTPEIIATADSVILDRCQRWTNLARHIVERHVGKAWVVDLA